MDSPVKNKWDLVVKVKYGDVLRRFNVSVDGQDIDHDMDKLRTKIINLFKFNANANIVLTYTDIDGDVVTLVDDDELHDAVFRQHLDPLRINVQLETDSAARADTSPYLDTSSRTGTEGTLMPHLRSAIDDALKSVPDPLRSALSSISYDYVSKASASAPVFGKLTEHFSKLGQSCDTGSTTYNSSKSADCGGVSHIATNPLDHSSDDMLKPLHDPVPRNPPSSNSNAVNQIPEDNTLPPGSGVMTGSTEKLFEEIWPECSLKNLRKPAACHAKDRAEGKKVAETGVKSIATASVPSADHQTVYQGCYENIIQTTPSVPPGVTDVLCSDMKNIPCSTSPFMSDFGFNSQKRFPVNKHWSEPAALSQIPCGVPQVLPVCGSQKQLLDSQIRTFHKGVRCDGCGMHPIIGPRFKSNVKEDFDLCSICFSGVGNEADYTRIDRAPYRSPRILKEFNHLHSRFHAPPGSRAYGLRPHKGKLESRFIQDVTILDGTLMAPSTPFTKIWRMRNNGTLVWPSGTQLVWIGGDRFAERGSAELEIPENGFPVDKEIDIAVDFRASSRPGRYISYWRMASPSGQKFGQRVWVLIQVDASRPNSAGRIIYPELNLNLPPEGSEQGGVGSFYVNAEPLESVVPSKLDMPGTKDLVQPLVNEISNPSNGSPSVLATLNETSPSLPEMPPPSSSSSLYPIIDLSQPFVPTSELVAPPPEEASLGSWPAAGENPVELTLLKELEEMGFRQIDLNKEVLRSNDYDLEQSLNDLCGFSEWDPLLEELQEMGFSDRERNKKLLIKNGGSIKRVVLDLIAGERAE